MLRSRKGHRALAARLIVPALAFAAGVMFWKGAAVHFSPAAQDAMDGAGMSGVLVLDAASTDGALTLSGSARVKSPVVYINSPSDAAVRASGKVTLDCPRVYAVGRASFNSPATCTGIIGRFPGPALDPYAGLSIPAADTAHDLGALTIHNGTRTVSPGYYSGGISCSGKANVTFSPGVYVLGSGLTLNGGSVTGDGVCFVVLSGRVTLSGGTVATLTPPTSGDLSGVVIAQPASNTENLNLAGGSGLVIHGSIWAPGAVATLTGNSSATDEGAYMGDMVIVKRLTLSGLGLLTIGNSSSPVFAPQVTGLYD